MYHSDVNMFSEESKKNLSFLIQEIREQYVINGHRKQFWLLPKRFTNKTLSCQETEKWLKLLSDMGALYYYKPVNNFDFIRDQAIMFGHIGDNHAWDSQMITPFITEFTTDSFPAYALDIYNTDLNSLVEALSKKQLFGSISKDILDRYYYNNVPLETINSSPINKKVFESFLVSDNHTLSSQQVFSIMATRNNNDCDNYEKRNQIMSRINKDLFNTSNHKAQIKSHKEGRTVDYYELIINQ